MTFIRWPLVGLLFSVVVTVSFSNTFAETPREADPIAILPPKDKIPDNLVLWPQDPNQSKYAIIADKAQRTLTVWENNGGMAKLVEAHPMDIGKRGGVKVKVGDHRTPEGIYFPNEVFEGSNLNFDEYGDKAFALDYPNFFDKRENKTGSGIWLHAIPDTKSLFRGSRGCVVVRNDIIKKLSPLISIERTPVIILDQVNYVTTEQVNDKAKSLLSWLDAWRADWSKKQIDDYINHYADDFMSLSMNRAVWKRYKDGLNQKYTFIDVKTLNPMAFIHKEDGILRFVQDYKSDTLNDLGIKTLYLKLKDNRIQIRGEEWKAASGDLLAHSKDN